MPKLEWISNPGIKFQAVVGRVHYYIFFPSIWTDVVDSSKSFYEKDAWMVTATKPIGQGGAINYVVAHGVKQDSDAELAAQRDWDEYGEEVPQDKLPKQRDWEQNSTI